MRTINETNNTKESLTSVEDFFPLINQALSLCVQPFKVNCSKSDFKDGRFKFIQQGLFNNSILSVRPQLKVIANELKDIPLNEVAL